MNLEWLEFDSSFATMLSNEGHFLSQAISNYIPGLRTAQNELNDRTGQKK